MGNEPLHYISYLVRVWREEAATSALAQWRAEVEHVQSGTRQRFESPGALWTYLRQLEPMGDDHHESEP